MSYFFEKERAFQRRKLHETLQRFQDEYFPLSRNALGPPEGNYLIVQFQESQVSQPIEIQEEKTV